MKKLLSTVGFAVLFIGLGFMAYLAVAAQPQTDDSVVANALSSSGEITSQVAPNAPSAANYNAIGLPLDSSATLAKADDLGNAIAGTQIVLEWREDTQSFDYRVPGVAGNNFDLTVGGAYFVQVNSSAPSVFSLVGDVPPQTGSVGAVKHSLLGDAANCKYNFITVPLDQSSVSTADQLASAIGNVSLVLEWRSDTQSFDYRVPGITGNNFAVKIGYPYFVCMAASKDWPS